MPTMEKQVNSIKNNEMHTKPLSIKAILAITGIICLISMLIKYDYNIFNAAPEFFLFWIGLSITAYLVQRFIFFKNDNGVFTIKKGKKE